MELEKIEGYVRCLLESWALHEDGEERVVWETLHDLLMAVSRYELMSAADKDMTTKLCKKLQYHFETKFSLKERKRKAKKENFPPNPLIKEKQKKEKEENDNTHTAERNFSSLVERREEFWKECLQIGKDNNYDSKKVERFFCRWAQVDKTTGRMKFEDEKYWNLEPRLIEWMSNSYTLADDAAATRHTKARGKQQKEGDEERRSKDMAAEREAANARREREHEAAKAGAVTMEEYIAKNPDSVLAKKFGKQ